MGFFWGGDGGGGWGMFPRVGNSVTKIPFKGFSKIASVQVPDDVAHPLQKSHQVSGDDNCLNNCITHLPSIIR